MTLNSSTPTRGSPSGQFTIGQTTEDVDVNGSWQVDLQADKTADTACLVPCDHPETELVCGDLDTTGKGSLVLTDAQATPPRCVRAIAKNGSGSSAVSVNKAKLTARKPADCNGDERITVSDIVCVNNAIFFGG